MPPKKKIRETPSKEELKEIIKVAQGQLPADLVIENAQIINTVTREIEEGKVLVKNGRIAGVLPKDYEVPKPAKKVDANQSYVAPSFMDAHIHFESSMLTLTNFAMAVIPRGTGLVAIDPHEITNVIGKEILREISQEANQLPLDVFLEIPSCVPAAKGLETPANELDSRDLAEIYDDPEIGAGALAEMMNFPGVLFTDEEIISRIYETRVRNLLVEGHAPGLSGAALNAYISAGIFSDHESTTTEEALEKLRRGMTLQLRHGSVAADLENILPGLIEEGLSDWRNVVLACDDRHPDDLYEKGHIDYSIKTSIELGLDPLIAIQLATINTATHLNLHKELGSITPGKWANMVIIEDLNSFKINKVIYRGQIVAENGKTKFKPAKTEIKDKYLRTVRIPENIDLNDVLISFEKQAKEGKKTVEVQIIKAIEKSLLTEKIVDKVSISDSGVFQPDIEKDYLPILVVDRHHGNKQIGKGIIHGFGIKNGAIASTIAHDTHNLVVVGSDYESILTAIRKIRQQQGGIVVSQRDKVLARLELPYGGLLSTDPVEKVAKKLGKVREATEKIGTRFHNPEMTLAFMALPVIPELKLTDKGLIDVTKFKPTTLVLEN